MACDCDSYIDCGDKSLEIASYDDDNEFSHQVSHASASDDVLDFYQKTERSFSVSHGFDRSISPGYVLTGCSSDGQGTFICDRSNEAIAHATVNEHCIRESNVPMYWDRHREIYVWKHVREELDFSVTSSKTAQFRMKWGTSKLNKVIIPTSVRVKGTEQFLMVRKGEKVVIAAAEYEYNPFPVNDVQGGNWGLYGNVVNNISSPDSEDVACILVFPTPPKLAMCQDNDCLYYGFYDYNAVEGGFVENSLSKDDGGKDYFYPYWCRSMPIDPLWRQVADTRYQVIYTGAKTQVGGSLGPGLNLEGVTEWTPSKPLVNPWPFGSFALDSKENFIASCVAQFGERVGKGIVYNESNVGNLFEALTKAGVSTRGPYTALYPVTPL